MTLCSYIKNKPEKIQRISIYSKFEKTFIFNLFDTTLSKYKKIGIVVNPANDTARNNILNSFNKEVSEGTASCNKIKKTKEKTIVNKMFIKRF